MTDVEQEYVDKAKHDGEQQDDDKCLMLCKACSHKFMMQMVFVCGEEWQAFSESYEDDARHIEYRYEEYGDT